MLYFAKPIRTFFPLAILGFWTLTAAGSDSSWLPGASLGSPGSSLGLPGKSKSKSNSVGVNRANKKPSMVKTASRTLSNIAQTPTELLHKSKSLLPGSSKPVSHSHSRQVSRVQKKEEKPSLLKSLFANETPPPPRTVGEWMALKRIDP